MNDLIEGNLYNDILKQVVSEIRKTRIVLSKRVNTTLIQLYWSIGKRLANDQFVEGYGKSVVNRLASDLKSEFSDYGFRLKN